VIASLLSVTVLGGCATNPPALIEDRIPRGEVKHRPVDPFPSTQVEIAPQAAIPPSPSPSVTRPAAVADPINPARGATHQLLVSADADMAQGQYEAAAVSVERAIRIAPDDPWAWHKLAQLHFRSGDYMQAKATAQRSNALPGASTRLVAANWLLIADIERSNGNTAAAELAYDKAQALLNRAPVP
jgi:hypothetical protein